jgi:hypothetical protein
VVVQAAALLTKAGLVVRELARAFQIPGQAVVENRFEEFGQSIEQSDAAVVVGISACALAIFEDGEDRSLTPRVRPVPGAQDPIEQHSQRGGQLIAGDFEEGGRELVRARGSIAVSSIRRSNHFLAADDSFDLTSLAGQRGAGA